METDSHLISEKEINDYLREFLAAPRDSHAPMTLKFIATSEVNDIDFKLFAYLILLNSKNPEIEHEIRLNKNDPDGGLKWQLLQFWTYAYLATGRVVFRAWFSGKEITFNLKKEKSKEKRLEIIKVALSHPSMFTLSKSFTPLLFVGQKSGNDFYSLFFKSDISEHIKKRVNALSTNSEKSPNLFDLSSGELLKYARKIIIKEDKDFSISSKIKDLATLAFLQCLFEANILNVYTFDEHSDPSEENLKASGLQMGQLTIRLHVDFYLSLKPIFSELIKKPPVYSFIFSILLSSELTKEKSSRKHRLTTKNKSEYVRQVFHLWDFAKDLIYGINEIARNAIEHSSTNQGVVFARIFKRTGEIPDASNQQLEVDLFNRRAKYFLSQDFSSLIEINVIDIGHDSILETLLRNTNNLRTQLSNEMKGDELLKLLQEDVKRIQESTYGLKSLLDPSSGEVLNQQAKRSIAHFGLLTLSKLVHKNGGHLLVCSGQSDSKDSCRIGDINKTTPWDSEHTLGTSFAIQLPISPSKPYRPDPVNRLTVPTEISESELLGLEELFKFEYVTEVCRVRRSVSKGLTPIVLVKPAESLKEGRPGEGETWRDMKRKIDEIFQYINTHTAILVHLDLQNVTFEGSQLFRLLGNIGIHFGHIPFLMTNISADRYFQLLEINALFHSINDSAAYWTENELTIAYPFVELDSGNRFFYTDVIWGQSESEHIAVNKMVSRNNFNALTTSQWKKRGLYDNKHSDPDLSFSSLFINRNVLLPFDLMLKSDDISLFEHNAVLLLGNKL